MATVLKSYLMEGASFTGTALAPVEQVDGFAVQGDDISGSGWAKAAISATGLPALWSFHPDWEYKLRAVEYRPVFQKKGTALVFIRYANVQPVVSGGDVLPFGLRGGTALVSTQTNLDRNRKRIFVSNENAAATPPVTAETRVPQPGVLNVLNPQSTFVLSCVRPTRLFDPQNGRDPILHSQVYGGKLNSVPFLGFARGKVLCETVSYELEGTIALRFSYEFRYNRFGWQPEVAWIDRKTGEPKADLVKAPGFDQNIPSDPEDLHYGLKVVDWFEYDDFNQLFV